MGNEADKIKACRRRKHKFRMRRRARRIYPDWPNAERAGDHIKVCSCWMCGNPRRFLKSKARIPVAERRAALRGAVESSFLDRSERLAVGSSPQESD